MCVGQQRIEFECFDGGWPNDRLDRLERDVRAAGHRHVRIRDREPGVSRRERRSVYQRLLEPLHGLLETGNTATTDQRATFQVQLVRFHIGVITPLATSELEP